MVLLVKARHIMRTLSLRGWEMFWGYQAPPQKELLVLPIQDDHPHDKVLILTEQILDLVFGCPDFRAQRNPVTAVATNSLECIFQAR